MAEMTVRSDSSASRVSGLGFEPGTRNTEHEPVDIGTRARLLTLVYPYYENGPMLERHLAEWSIYPDEIKQQIGVVIVDDGSPRDPAVEHLRGVDVGVAIDLYRIVPNIVWNLAGASNLGMHVAPDGWCLHTDIDHMVKTEDAMKLIGFLAAVAPKEPVFFNLSRRRADTGAVLHPHPNSYVLQRALYWRVGGKDEDFAGYWGPGNVFKKNLLRQAHEELLKDVYFNHFGGREYAGANTTEWGKRGTEFHWRRNPILVAKAASVPYMPKNPLRFDWRLEMKAGPP